MLKVSKFIKTHQLAKPSDAIIIGVSGGADSVALALILSELRHALGLRLTIAHYNHNVRKEAKSDEEFVRQLALKLNVPFHTQMRKGKVGDKLSEERMRNLRFAFFKQVQTQLKAQSVALAHTENDIAETVLMRIIRGSGLDGLRGIWPKREINGVVFIRPLLGLTRLEIEAYLKTKGQTFCHDKTNQVPDVLRNKIRLNVIPLLSQLNPGIANSLADLSRTVSDDYDFLHRYQQKRFKESVVSLKGKVKISLTALNKEHPAIRRLLLRKMVEDLTDVPLDFNHMREIEDLVFNRPQKSVVHLPGGVKVQKTSSNLEMAL